MHSAVYLCIWSSKHEITVFLRVMRTLFVSDLATKFNEILRRYLVLVRFLKGTETPYGLKGVFFLRQRKIRFAFPLPAPLPTRDRFSGPRSVPESPGFKSCEKNTVIFFRVERESELSDYAEASPGPHPHAHF